MVNLRLNKLYGQADHSNKDSLNQDKPELQINRLDDGLEDRHSSNMTMSMHSVPELVEGTSTSFVTANEISLISQSPVGGHFDFSAANTKEQPQQTSFVIQNDYIL